MRVPLTTADFLARAELVYGDRVGVVDEPAPPGGPLEGGRVTYRRLAELARAQAAGLDALGVGTGERVAIVSPNAARFLTALYGVTGSGRVLVPVNFRLKPAEVSYIVEHSGASVLLVDPEHDEALKAVDAPRRIVLGGEGDAEVYREGVEPRAWADPDEDATATVNYTSGTTARPKGVQLTHRNLWTNAVTFGWHLGVCDRDVYLHTLPMFHANGWGMPWAVAGMGVTQVVIRKIDGAEILRRVREHGVTLLCAAPAVLAAVLDAAEAWEGDIPGAGTLRLVAAGAPPPSRTIERVQAELGWEFNQIYGLTETSPLLTVNRQRAEWDDKPAAERASLLSRAGVPGIGVAVSTDETGEVLVRSNVVLAGYWRQPQESAAALAGGWFHTGDGGSVDTDGYLTISDRKKDVIITGGENVSSIEVEDRIYQHPDVAEVAVIGVPDERWGETVKALVVLREGQAVTEREVIDFARDGLAHYKCPTSVDFRADIPRTATGKVQKFVLRDSYWSGHDRKVN